MAQGREYLVYVSDDGTAAGNPIEVELQKDLTLNPGLQAQVEVYKNGQNAYINDSGFTAQFGMGNSAPLGVGEALVIAAVDSRQPVYAWVKNTRVGGLEWEGMFLLAWSNLRAPVNGDVMSDVTMAADGGAPVRSIKAAA